MGILLLAFSLFSVNILAEPLEIVGGGTSSDRLNQPTQATAECGPISPATHLQVCNRYQTEKGYLECLKIGKDVHFDACGLGFCNTYKSELGCTTCLTTIRNKNYTIEEITACHRLKLEAHATECMKAMGSPQSVSLGLMDRVKAGIHESLAYLKDGRVNPGIQRLEQILDEIGSHQ